MRNTETILNIIRDRGKRGLPIEDVYRQMYNPDLFLRAYGRIYRNDGAMTEGTTEETADGMSLDKIDRLIEDIRFERHRWKPLRRVQIPKKNGKKRPLSIPTWTDKLIQEVMRLLLDAYYEAQFSDNSHGFRPRRGCHTALREIQNMWTGTKWFIEGDIKGCFDNIDHEILLTILRERVHDNRFIRLVSNMLKTGHIEDWKYGQTLSGTPQGGIISPLLSNIYLDKLDRFVYDTLIPKYTRGTERKRNPVYRNIEYRLRKAKKKGETHEIPDLLKEQRQTPYYVTDDPDYRRLHYVRYADDFLLGFAGPQAEAEQVKEELRTFLREQLKLEMSEEKTLITHAATGMARFLGYDITGKQNDLYLHKLTGSERKHRSLNGKVQLRLPADVVEKNCQPYIRNGKPIDMRQLIEDSDYSIVAQYGARYRGLVQYYLLAVNVAWLHKLHWSMRTSCLKTLAAKHKSTVTKMVDKFGTEISTEHGPRKALAVTIQREGKKPLQALFGGIPLQRKLDATLRDDKLRWYYSRTELEKRLLATKCEICGSTENIQVHHIRKLADLKVKGRRVQHQGEYLMAARRRKTLVVCIKCHWDIHSGRPLAHKYSA